MCYTIKQSRTQKVIHMWKCVFVGIFFSICVEAQLFSEWHHCYDDEIGEKLQILDATIRIKPTVHGILGAEVRVLALPIQTIDSGLWSMEYWQESTGDKLKYQGKGLGMSK
eukprot:TRINITY_DN6004_c0_g1_i1.p1 TRINITY_DN6004_c0_g1~~TRINITY_DN6004_c0_g1_i1.p1  ORF type:complete len:111 (-),score=3.64 TRINITY_DN6004_c0_g1_i1:465-797(-)